MNEDDNQQTEPAAEVAVPAESEPSEAKTEVTTTEEQAKTGQDSESDPRDDEDGDDTDSEDDRPKRPSRYQRLKRERDALAAKVAQMESRPVAAAADDKATLDEMVRKEVGEPPKEADYDDWFAYERALTAYEADKRIATREIRRNAEQAKQAQQDATREMLLDYQERQRAAKASITDFDQVMKAAANLQVSNAVGQLLLESEKSAVIEYHLAKNPDVLHRLNAMSPLSAAKEIARLEDRLALPNPKTATKAAPPISTPKGGSSAPVDLSKLSMDEYVALRSKGAA